MQPRYRPAVLLISLVLAAMAGRADDAYEPNNNRATAFDLRAYPRTYLAAIRGLGVQANDDWFRIAAGASTRRLRIACLFSHAAGDIDLYLYDASGSTTWTGRAISSDDNEILDVTVPRAGDYYLWVRMGNAGNAYDLWWEASDGSDDRYAPNPTLSQAFDLAPYANTWLSALRGPGLARQADWYRLVIAPDAEELTAYCDFTHAAGNLDLRLYDAAHTLLGTAQGLANDEQLTVVTPGGGGVYYLEVSSPAYTGSSYDLRWSSRAPPAQPPANLTASDGASATAVQLNWQPGAYAKNYEIFRHTGDSLANATLLATTPETNYSDTAVTVGTVFHYWVRSLNASGPSPFSNRDTGFRTLAAPATVTASDGAFNDKVQVKCSSVQGATSYKLYRAASPDFAAATQLGTLPTSTRTYDDKTAALDTLYYYWVRGVGAGGDGLVSSAVESGYRGRQAPTTVSASDGAYNDKVRVTWNAVSGAVGYEVLRGLSTSSSAAESLGSSATLTFDDATATPLQTYYYWVRTLGAAGPGLLSSVRDSGWRAQPPVVTIASQPISQVDILAAEPPATGPGRAAPLTVFTRNLRLTWEGEDHSRYQVQGSDSLAPPLWEDIGLPLPGSNGWQHLDLPIGAGQPNFFRLLRLTP